MEDQTLETQQSYDLIEENVEEIDAEIDRSRYHQYRDDEYLASLYQQRRELREDWRDF